MKDSVTRFKMADISAKPEIVRTVTASGRLALSPDTIRRLAGGKIEKGDPFSAGELAAIAAAKNTSQILPLCHQVPIDSMHFKANLGEHDVVVEVSVTSTAKTGVEMEALVAVSVYLLTVWDMTKMYEKDTRGQYPGTTIVDIRVIRKEKGAARRKVNTRA